MGQADKPSGYDSSFGEWNRPGANHQPERLGLNAMIDINDPIKNDRLTMKETKFTASPNDEGIMKFKTASSNPRDMNLPLGRSYADFPASRANDSVPRDAFQQKVDVDKIEKGNAATVQDTGKAHG